MVETSSLASHVLEALRCPACKGTLRQASCRLECTGCAAEYRVEDGIPSLVPVGLDENIRLGTAAWSNLTWDYDLYIAGVPPERLALIDAPLLAQCVSGHRVLEVGCGTARLRLRVEAAGGRYVGLDPSLALLRQGAANGARALVHGVGEHLPFPDSHFDVIIGGYASFRYIQLHMLYPECARVLKPRGVMAFTLWNNWSLFAHSVLQGLRAGRPWAARFRPGSSNDVVSPAREMKRLRESGFTVESILSTPGAPPPGWMKTSGQVNGRPDYWRGRLGALFGHDIIFVCRHEQERSAVASGRHGAHATHR